MSEGTNTPKDELMRLGEERNRIGRALADLQLQLHVIDRAIHELSEKAQGKVIQLELTKNQAGLLMAICFHFAARSEAIGSETQTQINDLGHFIFDAMFRQDADFAQRLTAMHVPASSRAAKSETPQTLGIPKKDKPYLRYTDEQREAACEKSQIGSPYDYCRLDYARLYLTRDALLEMLRQPRHLKAVFANILASVDAHGRDHCGPVGLREHGLSHRDVPAGRAKPYDQYSDKQMRTALKVVRIRRTDVKFSYGRLAVSFHRDTLLQLYRQPPYVKPAIAYLLKLFDEHQIAESAQFP